ncbi:MAG: cobalamin-binding protein [Treponema sp.]|nr:cobalamin-binding protein [Treponema sp.]
MIKKIATAFLFIAISLIFSGCTKEKQRNVKIPERIVSLSPAGTEIICALDAMNQLVARTDFCDYPPEVSKLPSAGGFDGKIISLETVLSFEPDFVYLAEGIHDHLLPLLKQNGISYYLSNANSVESVINEILEVGKITGHYEKAKKLTAGIEQKLNELRKNYENTKPVSVYWEVWNPPYMSVGKDSFINELIEYAGGKNIFSDLAQPYPIVSEENIFAAKPDVIIIPDHVSDGIKSVKKRAGWEKIPAIKNNRIFEMDSDLVSRPSPRIAETAEIIAKALHE